VDLIKHRIASGKNESPGQNAGTQMGPPRLDDEFSNYLFISQLYNKAGLGSESAAAAEQAYAVAGGSERQQIARLMTATARQTSGKFDEAEMILRDILRSSPGNPIALNNLGYFLVERGQNLSEALGLIQRAIAIDPNNPSYVDSLGWAYFKLGRFDDSIRTLELAKNLDDTSAAIQEHLGDAYRMKGNLDLARSAWQKASVLISGAADLARIKEKLDNLK
jgi:predicted Zn-dependent protease